MAIEDKKDRDIVFLTGLPVSDEMQDILERCADGKYVDVEEVKATPEMKAAESCVSNATPTINLKDREPIQNHVFETLMNYGSISLDESGKPLVDSHGNTIYNNDVERGRRLDIVIGLPASGKSSAIVDTISYEHHSMLIDNDEAKRQFPEFNKGWGANTVHKESQIVEQAVFREALREGRNIVLPKVGSDADKLMENYIAYAKDAGYKVNVHFVDLDRNKALGRMMGRFIHTGRYLSPELIDKYANERDGNRIAQAYEALKSMDGIDGCSKWDNDVGRGEKPILLEAANLDDDFIKNARMKGDMENEERKHGPFTRGSEDDLCFSGDSAGDRGADEQSGKGNKRADGRNGEHDTGRAVSVPEADLRQVSGDGVSHPELFDEKMDKSRKEELFPTALFVSKSQQDVVEAFRAKTRDLFHELDGQNAESIESMVRGHVEDALQTFDIDAQVVDVVLVGSRCRGIEHEDSDVDVVVEYYGSEREDSLFSILNEEGLSIGGRNIDINPITKDRSGTLETYLPEVEKYLAEKAQSMEQPSRDMAGEVAKEQEAKEKHEQEEAKKGRPEKHKTGKFANFSMQKSDESEKYYLYSDIKYPSGDIERHKPIAEFPDKKQAEEFCKSRGINCDDVTDNLENVIRHKKQVASEKGKTSPSRETGRKHGDIGDE